MPVFSGFSKVRQLALYFQQYSELPDIKKKEVRPDNALEDLNQQRFGSTSFVRGTIPPRTMTPVGDTFCWQKTLIRRKSAMRGMWTPGKPG